jgi:hypothetical protein
MLQLKDTVESTNRFLRNSSVYAIDKPIVSSNADELKNFDNVFEDDVIENEKVSDDGISWINGVFISKFFFKSTKHMYI